MAVRMEIELTSARPDGTWTWRAAGAREPKGSLDGALLREPAKVGDVLRVDANVEIDGIVVTVVLPSRSPRAEPERLQLLDVAPPASLVTGPPVKEARRDGAQARQRERPRREDRSPRSAGRERPERSRRPRAEPAAEGRPPRERRSPERTAPSPPPERRRPKRLQPRREHRNAVLGTLAPEQVPVAEQLLRGGIPAVRQAVQEQNEKARASGDPQIPLESVLAIAEDLLPRMRVAEWRDRAEAALASVDDVALRDLRAVVAGADTAARDEPTRALAAQLREATDRRVLAERDKWATEIASALDEGRVVRALRVSARPPEPGGRIPIEVATRLTDAAGAALAPDVAADRWSAVLEAVAASPVRNSVQPVGLPATGHETLVDTGKEAASKVPAVAELLGLKAPAARRLPPPPPPPPQ